MPISLLYLFFKIEGLSNTNDFARTRGLSPNDVMSTSFFWIKIQVLMISKINLIGFERPNNFTWKSSHSMPFHIWAFFLQYQGPSNSPLPRKLAKFR